MTKALNVYFDYICPYCYHSVMDLLELLPEYLEISANWIPCEAHPRPEPAWMHSDLASQAMLAVKELGGDLLKFHRAVFEAHFKDRKRINNISVLAGLAAACNVDADQILAALKNGKYKQAVLDNNHLVWERLHFEAVPDYQYGKLLLVSQEDVLISRKELRAFLDSIVKQDQD